MKTNIFVNLAVKDLEKTKNFFSNLGYKFNQQFTNDKGAGMIIDDNIFVMLVQEDFFKKLTKKDVFDAHKAHESAVAISMDSKQKVDEWVNKAISLGATENIVPEMNIDEQMYGRSINDPDGHIWEVIWMNPKMIEKY